MLKDKSRRTKFNLFLDVVLTAAFLVSLKPFVTGMAFHEWLGLAFGVGLALHTALHWRWVVGITTKLFGKLPLKTRVYYTLDAALLAAFTTIIVSGVVMSTTVLPLLGVQGIVSLTVAQVHSLASYLTLALLGVKLALHWAWIKNAIRRLTSVPATRKPVFQPAGLVPVPVTSGNAAKAISRRHFLLIGCSAVGMALLASINKNQQAQGDPVATPTEVLSTAATSTATDTALADASAAPTTPPVEVAPTAVIETAVPTAIPPAIPTATAVPQQVATRCPRGLVNDPYPGRCRRYVDKNGNGICDLSETA